jgi:ectoine hydroxylase-related dioxygenase (phytanoyl-CoA dioxygenase family)
VATAEEVAGYEQAIDACVMEKARDAAPLEDRDTYHKAFLQVANLWETSPAVARFTMARRFARIAAELMGVSAVRLYHDQALFKEPGGGPTPWHQDQYYWPLDTDHCVTMWMPLVDVPTEMGVLTFASGSHADGDLCETAISDASEAALQQIVLDRRMRISGEAMRAGDATFHAGWTVHMAPGNSTNRMRKVMTVIYFADGTRLLEPDNPHRPADLARWFPQQQPGEVAGGPLTPVLYSRDD